MNEYGDLVPAAQTVMHIIERAAKEPAMDLDRIEKLLELKETWEKREAAKAFIGAMVEFKKDAPVIYKNKRVAYGNTRYNHATHDEVTIKIMEGLAHVGIVHAWRIVEQSEDRMTVECTITHVAGHSESARFSGPYDTSGGKNAVQGEASVNTYLQRYTLLMVCGMTTGDAAADTDGRDDDTPTVHPDIWIALQDAAIAGNADLRKTWSGISAESREVIAKHHSKRWESIKAQGALKP